MSKQSICEKERSYLSKMNKFQLGNQFKKVGYGIAIAAFILMIGRKYIENSEWLRPILHGVLLIGLLVISLSKEKLEDEYLDSLKVQRAILDLTQEDLAKKIGVSRQTINSIEKNRYVPSTVLALKLSAVFNISVNDFFILEDED